MPTECSPTLFEFAPAAGRAVVAGFDGGAITSDAGALLLGATDRAIGLVTRFATCFADARDPDRIEHAIATLVGQRVFGIALGYEDLIDHDQLRRDPALAILAGKLEARRAACAPLPAPRWPARARSTALSARPRAVRAGITASATTARRSRRCSWTCSSTRTARRRGRSSSTWMPPTCRCTGIRKAGSSTVKIPKGIFLLFSLWMTLKAGCIVQFNDLNGIHLEGTI